MNKYYGWKASFALPALAALLFLAGCGADDGVVAGETIDVKETFGCYVPTSPGKHAVITENAAELMLAGAVWSVDDGLVLLDSNLGFSLGAVKWQVGTTYYTVGGVWIQAQAKIGVAEGARKGLRSIRVRLPSLPTVAQALGGTAECASGRVDTSPLMTSYPEELRATLEAFRGSDPPDAYTSTDLLTVSTLRIYGSGAARDLACIGTIILVIAGVVGYVALVRRH